MSSYWERRLQDNRKRSLQAQADRYSAQVPGAVREAQERLRVEKAQRQQAQSRAAQAQRGREQEQSRQAGLSEQRAQAEARVAQSQRDREIRELEAAQRAQAEARANFAQAQRDAEASAQAERISPTRSLSGETVAPPSDPLEFYGKRVAKQENQAAMRDFWEYVAYGPERRSVLGGEAGKVERFLRDWGISEQEAREGVERLGEGRVLSGAGYLGLAAAGVGANVGDLRRFALRAARGSRFLPGAADAAADVARAADAGQARIAEIVRNNADELDRIKTERVQQMTRTDEVDQQALARASRAVRDMSPENIWVIHETSFPPMQSGRGVELRPTGNYRPETGRNTVHFTLNHTAAGHEMRGSRSAPYVVVARLSDVLEANPGSLDNLNAIDTFLTPAPGQSLNLPNAVVLQNSQSAQTQTAIRDLVEGSGGTIIAGGKRESLTIGADARIRQLARELNAPSVLHDNHPSYLLEMSHLSGGGMMNADPEYYLPLMSDNARLRAAQDDIWNRPNAPDRRQMVFKGEDDV